MIHLTINHQNIEVQSGISILEACKTIGALVPRFCYHEMLSIAGNCRVCLVEIEGIEKPIASCLTEVTENMVVYTDSIFARKARENVVETLLLHHPLDCPVCDQAGECDLQDQTRTYASDRSKYFFEKRGVEDKNFGALIKTIMTRCIHCTRCVRYSSEVAGVDFLGTLNRGSATEIGTYSNDFFKSEISGNVIDLCPVGAITARPFGFKARPWELQANESIDTTDTTSSNVYVYFKEKNIARVLPKNNNNINGQIITDAARFSYDAQANKRLKHVKIMNKRVSREYFPSWNFILDKIEKMTHTQTPTLLNVAGNVGFETLEILKHIGYVQKSFSLHSISGVRSLIGNSYIWGLADTINSIQKSDTFGVTISVNPKVECSTINARIRAQTLNTVINFVNMNMNLKNNFSGKNINLNLSRSLKLFEAKDPVYTKRLYKAKVPLILIGDSLKKRGMNILSFIIYLKHKFNNVKILKPSTTINNEALELLNIPVVSARKKFESINDLALNLTDSFSLRKIFKHKKRSVIWFDTHKILNRKIKSKILAVAPIFSEYEEEKSILNLEQRPQRTKHTFKKFFEAKSLKKFFKHIFRKKEVGYDTVTWTPFPHLSRTFAFFAEMHENTSLFNQIKKKFVFLNFSAPSTKINIVSKYIQKAAVSNFFSSSKKLKLSSIMARSVTFNSNTIYI